MGAAMHKLTDACFSYSDDEDQRPLTESDVIKSGENAIKTRADHEMQSKSVINGTCSASIPSNDVEDVLSHHIYRSSSNYNIPTIIYPKITMNKHYITNTKNVSQKKKHISYSIDSELLIAGNARIERIFIPKVIIKLILKYYKYKKQTKRFGYDEYGNVYIFDPKNHHQITMHYKPWFKPLNIYHIPTIKCIAHCVVLTDNIKASYNRYYSSINKQKTMMNLNRDFDILFVGKTFNIHSSELGLSCLVFNRFGGFELDIPIIPNINEKQLIYSDKYGLLCIDKDYTYYFSLNQWNWTKKRNYWQFEIHSSSMCIIDEDRLFITNSSQQCMIVDFENESVIESAASIKIISASPSIYYDMEYKRVYTYCSNTEFYQFYDIEKDKWYEIGHFQHELDNKRIIWIDDDDKNILYSHDTENLDETLVIHLRAKSCRYESPSYLQQCCHYALL